MLPSRRPSRWLRFALVLVAGVLLVGTSLHLAGPRDDDEHRPLAAGVVATKNGRGAAPDTRPWPRVLVIAHRGDSVAAPENTVPAMLAAARAHADLVEFDVQRTADGQLIVVHDGTFARTTNIASVYPARALDPVGSFTLAQVERLDAGSWFGPAYAGTRIPTLQQLLAAMKPTHTGLLLELKNPSRYPGYEKQVAAALQQGGWIGAHRVYVHSFDVSALRRLHSYAPSVPLGLITTHGVGALDTLLGVQTINSSSISDAGIDRADAARLPVIAWPRNDAPDTRAQVDQLVADGVSGLIADNPSDVRRWLDALGAVAR